MPVKMLFPFPVFCPLELSLAKEYVLMVQFLSQRTLQADLGQPEMLFSGNFSLFSTHEWPELQHDVLCGLSVRGETLLRGSRMLT